MKKKTVHYIPVSRTWASAAAKEFEARRRQRRQERAATGAAKLTADEEHEAFETSSSEVSRLRIYGSDPERSEKFTFDQLEKFRAKLIEAGANIPPAVAAVDSWLHEAWVRLGSELGHARLRTWMNRINAEVFGGAFRVPALPTPRLSIDGDVSLDDLSNDAEPLRTGEISDDKPASDPSVTTGHGTSLPGPGIRSGSARVGKTRRSSSPR